MKLTFLGTAASEGYPAPFCLCANCQEARRRGGRSIRLRSSLLINDDLLIDYGPDVVAASTIYGIDLSKVETLLITHPHEDHLTASQLYLRAHPFSLTDLPHLEIYGPADAMAKIADRCPRTPEEARFGTQVVSPGDEWARGRYNIVAFHATHGTQDPLLYAIDDDRHRLLYSLDTAPYSDETWRAIKGYTYEMVIMDETMGTAKTSPDSGHMGIDAVIAYRQAFEKEGLLRRRARFLTSHMSHGANPCHEELVDLLRPHGIAVAYDALCLKLK